MKPKHEPEVVIARIAAEIAHNDGLTARNTGRLKRLMERAIKP